MAKGQKHSNKEIKKPKKDKSAATLASTFLGQIKASEHAKQHR